MKIKSCIARYASLAVVCLLSFNACSSDKKNDDDPAGESFERLEFAAPEMASFLGSDFAAFVTANAAYEIVPRLSTDDRFIMGGYVEIDAEKINITIEVDKDIYGKIGAVRAIPDDASMDKKLYNHYVANSETLALGNWLGAKYVVVKSDGTFVRGGLYQTVEEALDAPEIFNIDELLIYAIFGITPNVYAVPTFEKGRFKMQLVNNFFRLDYSVLYDLLGADYQSFATANYIIGSKMSMFGENWFYCHYALDLKEHLFNCDINTDSEQKSITSFEMELDKDKYTVDEQLDVWKSYASEYEALHLGEFKEGYRISFGTKSDIFKSAAEALAWVEANGRPSSGFDPDIVLVFGNDKASVTITLKSLKIEIAVTPVEAA